MSYPYDPYNNFKDYLHEETFNYTRNQPIHHLMSRPEFVDYGPQHPHPMDQQMNQVYHHGNNQHGYNMQQGLYVPQPRAFNLNERREYPPNQVTANIRLSNSQYMNGLVCEIRRSTGWDVTAQGPVNITVTGHTTDFGRDGQDEILREVKSISRDDRARLC